MTVAPRPFVSILIPCRNEREFIGQCLDSVLANDYPADRREVLVIDGMSEDGTPAIVEAYTRRHSAIRLLPNHRHIVPAALNLGIESAQGDIIMRMDAHNEYPSNYVSTLVDWLERTGADNVGAAWVTQPADTSAIAKAIARSLAHPFGIGNAQFRLGVREPTRVDTVPFGCYRRDVFERLGGFDEELVRNQDDEFNFRLLRAGGLILLVPGVVSYYRARRSIRQLARTYYQYGYFKPLVAYKVAGIMTFRQLAPPAFLLALAVGILLALLVPAARVPLLVLAGSYLAVDLAVSLGAGRRDGVRCGLALSLVFPVLHLAYGAGFLVGALRLLGGGRRTFVEDPAQFPLSRW